ncbi:hypothetical protein FisN_12Hh379 [Fistulifera solaris]|uniref:NECAP PHear domain-containing protein n=1 Tax=Fistulifera solaris TaxID=1519565 RepID=A0A1Z5KC24_FISSO|nr:hypothetical protein FisN_12Hh379 [Fistulifera solaris]|eukprot:GAX23797.1 hypothetical protein FisN_12Hh379 [Fistulifera solaris]
MEDESAARQKLMAADEVYVYKIPPMKGAGGHRADDWDLANPLQTCNLVVEMSGNTLYLEFMHEGTLFAQSKMVLDKEKHLSISHFIQDVVDSSRYFAIKIQGVGGKEATIGFGFRDREKATDLRESLQYFQKSVNRESEAQTILPPVSIPVLEQGEKIHVNLHGKSTISKTKTQPEKTGKVSVPLLLKKPPPPAGDE